MEHLASVMRKFTESISNPKELDVVTFIDFQEILVRNYEFLALVVGFERGFQVWDLSKPSEPELLLSKRNLGVSQISYISGNDLGNLAMTSLYHSLEFPRSQIKIFSIISRDFIC